MNMFLRAAVPAILLAASLPSMTAAQADRRPQGKPAEQTALDHLRAARTILAEVKGQSLTRQAAAKLKDIQQRLATLERSYVSYGKKTMSKQETPSGGTRVRIGREGDWSSHVPEIDKLLGELIEAKTPIARQPEENDSPKRTLTTVRTHLTAFAKGASGTSGPPR
jgi:hypothetical protein